MHLVILTFCLTVTTANRRHVVNSVEPFCEGPPVYDVSNWVNKLHLQRCVIVEIGQGHCALFVESTEASPIIKEYFLGICEKEVIMKWRLCNTVLEDLRPADCIFSNDTIKPGVRVHRKLCDISNLAYYGESCSCDTTLSGIMKNNVCGFPTCFINPLPESICTPLNVCGHHICNASTTVGKIHMVTCNPNCLGKQPFCEFSEEYQTGHTLEITSFWSDWSNPLCSELFCSSEIIYMEATCINSITGTGAVDCLGPGTSCCPRDVLKCKCNTFMENGVLKVYRTYVNPLWNHTEERSAIRIKRNMRQNPDERFLQRLFKLVDSKQNNRNERTVETEDYEDDDDDDDDSGGEDIAIEEDTDNEKPSSTTESPEKVEMKLKMKENAATVKSFNITQNAGEDENDEVVRNSCRKAANVLFVRNRSCLVLITLLCIF